MNYQRYSSNILLCSWIFVTIGKNSCFSKDFPCIAENVISLDFNLSWNVSIRYVFLENLTFTTFLEVLLLTQCYRFLTRCRYYLWLDSKYINLRRCDVFGFRIKQFTV